MASLAAGSAFPDQREEGAHQQVRVQTGEEGEVRVRVEQGWGCERVGRVEGVGSGDGIAVMV